MHNNKRLSKTLATSCLCALTGLPMLAQASGFAIPELSISGIGLSNALVANPDDIGAFAYNPAAMAFHEGSSVNLGAMLIKPDMQVTTDTGKHESGGKSNVGVPTFYGALRLTDDWTLGLGVGAPFGLETKWDVGTFPVLSQPTTTPLHPTKSKLQMVAFSPAVAYRINDNATMEFRAATG